MDLKPPDTVLFPPFFYHPPFAVSADISFLYLRAILDTLLDHNRKSLGLLPPPLPTPSEENYLIPSQITFIFCLKWLGVEHS